MKNRISPIKTAGAVVAALSPVALTGVAVGAAEAGIATAASELMQIGMDDNTESAGELVEVLLGLHP